MTRPSSLWMAKQKKEILDPKESGFSNIEVKSILIKRIMGLTVESKARFSASNDRFTALDSPSANCIRDYKQECLATYREILSHLSNLQSELLNHVTVDEVDDLEKQITDTRLEIGLEYDLLIARLISKQPEGIKASESADSHTITEAIAEAVKSTLEATSPPSSQTAHRAAYKNYTKEDLPKFDGNI